MIISRDNNWILVKHYTGLNETLPILEIWHHHIDHIESWTWPVKDFCLECQEEPPSGLIAQRGISRLIDPTKADADMGEFIVRYNQVTDIFTLYDRETKELFGEPFAVIPTSAHYIQNYVSMAMAMKADRWTRANLLSGDGTK